MQDLEMNSCKVEMYVEVFIQRMHYSILKHRLYFFDRKQNFVPNF